jgi:hypothetical protein
VYGVSNVVRQLIFVTAADEPQLSKLPWCVQFADVARQRPRDAPLRIDELRPVLGALLREGHVLLVDVAHPVFPLTLDDAVARIADDDNWTPRARSGGRSAYAVILTERGGAEYRLHARLRTA